MSTDSDLRVYVSSTSIDLKEYRAAVISALRKTGTTPVCMEDYVAQDMLPVDKCLADVAGSEVYVGIFAWRYGFMPSDYEQSITELEYRKAIEVSIPTLIFLLDENVGWHDEYRDVGKDAKRISALRKEFKLGKMVGWFTNPHHLASEVLSAVNRVFMQKIVGQRYAEVSIASTSEQSASLKQAMALMQEAMRQQAIQARQTTRDPIPIQLPKLRGVFVGREAEQETLYHCLKAENKRMVVIVAPGGYGKTELMTKVLKGIAPSTSIINGDVQGILYLKCVRADITLGQVFTQAGCIVGKSDEFRDVYANKELSLNKKLEYFFAELSKAGNVWIVMDNFEDLLNSNDDSICDLELREFLETAVAIEHTIRMIITSRAVPSFKGSRRVEKIDLSSGLPEDQAIKYLREEGAEYGLAAEDENVLRSFVRRVHRIPKALESTLGYLEDHYPAIKLSDLLKDDALFVDFDRHDMENGLKGLVSQQFKIQSPDAQLVLSALSIFPKPAPQAALRYLLQAIESAEFSAIMSRLEKNRLINHNNGYYDLHPIVRSFVYERIPEGTPLAEKSSSANQGEILALTRSNLHSRAADFYKELRKQKEEWKTIDDLEPQLQEFHHLVHAGQYESAARVLGVIDFDFLQLWGYAMVVIDMREQLLGKLKDDYLNRTNLGSLGTVYSNTGRVREAIPYYEKALVSARSDNSKQSISCYLSSLGNAFFSLGELRKALEYYEQALAVSQEISNREMEGTDLSNIGRYYSEIGQTRKAMEYFEQALTINREFGDRQGEAINIGLIGKAYSQLGQTRMSIEYFEQALSIARVIGARTTEGADLSCIGSLYLDLGEPRKGVEYFERALTIARETAYCYGEGWRLRGLGLAYLELGDITKALGYYEKALAIAREIENPDMVSTVLFESAYTHHHTGQLADAWRRYEESLSLGTYEIDFCCAILMGILRMEEGKEEESRRYFKRGIDLCRDALGKSQASSYEPLYKLALSLLAIGDLQGSKDAYKQALDACSEKGVVTRQIKDLQLLERAAPGTEGLKAINKLLTGAINSSSGEPT